MSGTLGWQASPAAWLALLGAVFAAGAALVAYRRVGHIRFSKAMLLARLGALLLLAMAAFAPSLDVSAATSRKRQIVVVIDDSLSMGVSDARNEGQSLRIAQALGLIGRTPWVGDDLLDQARQLPTAMSDVEAARAQRDQARLAALPAMAEQQKVDELTAALRDKIIHLLTSAQASEALRFAVEPLTQMRQALDVPNAVLPARAVTQLITDAERSQRQADTLRARQDADSRAAVKRTTGMSRYDLARSAAEQLSTVMTGGAAVTFTSIDGTIIASPPDKPARQASPVTTGLGAAVDHIGPADCEGLILLSDGRSTEPHPALSSALLGAGLPIYPVEIALGQNAPDVRIARLTAPASALVGESIPVRVTLQNHGAGGVATHVNLTDGKTTQTRAITLTDAADTVDFVWPAAALPSLHLTASVDSIPNEARTENNRSEASVTVVDRKLHVAFISGSAGWDAQYLRNALARSPWVELHQQVLASGESCRLTPKELAAEDVFVLCDLSPGALDTAQCDAIHTAVVTGGKSALLLPGSSDWFRTAAKQPLLASLLPQRADEDPIWRLPPSEAPTIQPVPAPRAVSLPFLKLDDSADASFNRWLARPRMYRFVAGGELKPQVRTLLIDRSTETPLLVEQAVGSGRSMTMLIDETWRWRRDTGADAGDRFWLDIVRDLVDPPMAKTQGDLSIGVDRDPTPAGQILTVRARVPVGAAARLALIQNGKTVAAVSPSEILPGSGRLTATLTPDTAGPAELVLTAGNGEVRLPITIGDSLAEEMADTSGDPALLHRIADQTGGVMVSLEQLDKLPPQIALRRSQRVDTIHLDLWSSPYWFAAIVACLGLEWAMRKLAGMI